MKNGFHVFSRVFPKMVGGLSVILFATSGSFASTIDLSKAVLTEGSVISVSDGDVLTGTLGGNYKISIANGATVMLSNAVINGVDNENYQWAGLTCEGDCKIVLDEGSENSVKGFYRDYPGIYVPDGHTLTIEGSGKLDAVGGGTFSDYTASVSYGAGIGGGLNIPCGNIVIDGGDITATAIHYASGIGCGYYASCGDITITDKVSKLTVVRALNASGNLIGKGYYNKSPAPTVGTITIGGKTTTGIVGYQFTYPKIPYTVVFDANGGSGSMEEQVFYLGNDQLLSSNKFTREGYVFAGWNTEPDGGGYIYADRTAALDLTDKAGGSVTLYAQWQKKGEPFNLDLSKLKSDYTIQDGFVLSGTLEGKSQPYKISIADNATVTLDGARVNEDGFYKSWYYDWAGLTCSGNCKILLTEGRKNIVKHFNIYNPGIYVPKGYTLTIEGDGKLDVFGGVYAAGIGGGYTTATREMTTGNIVINGGTVTATGGDYGAGIGGGYTSSYAMTTVGNITINGGTVTATGGYYRGAGIGGGYTDGRGTTTVGDITINGGTVTATGDYYGAGIGGGITKGTTTVGDITISDRVIMLTATAGSSARNSVGNGYVDVKNGASSTIGTITVAGVETGPIETNPFVYFNSNIVLLDTLSKDYTATDGKILTGKTPDRYTVTIDRVQKKSTTVTLWNANISGGIITELDATIILEGENYAKGKRNEAGVWIPVPGYTLTIKGEGSLEAVGGENSAGIGIGGFNRHSGGNLVIEGGSITAIGSEGSAGIGSGSQATNVKIGDITIKSGTVKADGFVGIGIGEQNFDWISMGDVRLYHGFKEIDATITGNPIYMYGETDVSSNPSEYFGIDGSVTRSLFAIGTDKLSNGKVEAKTASANGKAYAGEPVTLAVTPDFGYNFEALTIKDASGNDIDVKNNSFVMPQGDVTVSADFASKYPMLTFSDNGKKVTVNGTYGGTEAFELDEDISVESAVLDRTFVVADESSTKRARSTVMLPFDIAAKNVSGFSRVLAFKRIGSYTDPETGTEKSAMYVSYVWCAEGYRVEKCPESDAVLEAYRPYIVELEDGLTKISLTGPVTLKKTAGINTDRRSGDWVFRGMLRYKKWDETADKAQLTGCNGKSCIYGYAASGDKNILGQFVRIAAGAYIYPFRAYLGYEPEEQQPVQAVAPANASYVLRPDVHVRGEEIPENMDVVVDDGDGETTVIGQFNTRTGEFRMNGAATRRTFDAKGRNVGDKVNKARGAYYGKSRK